MQCHRTRTSFTTLRWILSCYFNHVYKQSSGDTAVRAIFCGRFMENPMNTLTVNFPDCLQKVPLDRDNFPVGELHHVPNRDSARFPPE